jgi:hypothetical protein
MLPPHELINLIIQVLDHEIAQTRILFLAELREILFSTRAEAKKNGHFAKITENYRTSKPTSNAVARKNHKNQLYNTRLHNIMQCASALRVSKIL